MKGSQLQQPPESVSNGFVLPFAARGRAEGYPRFRAMASAAGQSFGCANKKEKKHLVL